LKFIVNLFQGAAFPICAKKKKKQGCVQMRELEQKKRN